MSQRLNTKWAAEMGIVSRIGNNNYAPEANISRQDLSVFLSNYAEKNGVLYEADLAECSVHGFRQHCGICC